MKNKFNGYKEYISSLLISFLIALLISIAVFTAIYLYGEKIINEYVEKLAIGISNLINIFEPEITVIGGSFTYYQSILLEPLKEKIIKEKLLFNKRDNINIVAAKLFNDAGIIGAGNL